MTCTVNCPECPRLDRQCVKMEFVDWRTMRVDSERERTVRTQPTARLLFSARRCNVRIR